MLKIKVKILFCFFTLASSLTKTCVRPIELKVLALNTWGMPATFGSEDKEERMKDIGEFIQKEEFHIYLLSELWMRPDHATIKSYIPKHYVMTDVGQFSNGLCDGIITPHQCSGLSIVSRFPLDEISFTKYEANAGVEILVAKGIGRIRIEPTPRLRPGPPLTVDVFVTHTCADEENAPCREKQVSELVGIIKESDADFVVLGGDLNVDPRMKETSYQQILGVMNNSMVDAIDGPFNFTDPRMATHGNPENTYSYKESPVVLDYIFHKAKENNSIETTFFQIPILKSNNANRSLSDHEAVATHLSLCKPIKPLFKAAREENNDKVEGMNLDGKYSKLEKMVLKGNNKLKAQMPEMEEDILDEDSTSFDKEMPELTWMKSKRGKSRFDDQTTARPRNSAPIKCKRWPCVRFPRDFWMKNKRGKSRFDDQIRRQLQDRKIKRQMRDWEPRPHHSRDYIECKRWPCVRSPRDFWERNRDAMARVKRKEHGGEKEDK